MVEEKWIVGSRVVGSGCGKVGSGSRVVGSGCRVVNTV